MTLFRHWSHRTQYNYKIIDHSHNFQRYKLLDFREDGKLVLSSYKCKLPLLFRPHKCEFWEVYICFAQTATKEVYIYDVRMLDIVSYCNTGLQPWRAVCISTHRQIQNNAIYITKSVLFHAAGKFPPGRTTESEAGWRELHCTCLIGFRIKCFQHN
jgi:hypothetical protein